MECYRTKIAVRFQQLRALHTADKAAKWPLLQPRGGPRAPGGFGRARSWNSDGLCTFVRPAHGFPPSLNITGFKGLGFFFFLQQECKDTSFQKRRPSKPDLPIRKQLWGAQRGWPGAGVARTKPWFIPQRQRPRRPPRRRHETCAIELGELNSPTPHYLAGLWPAWVTGARVSKQQQQKPYRGGNNGRTVRCRGNGGGGKGNVAADVFPETGPSSRAQGGREEGVAREGGG